MFEFFGDIFRSYAEHLPDVKIKEINGLFQMDTGAPSPVVICDDCNLTVSFYRDNVYDEELHMRNSVFDPGVVTLRFNSFCKYSFGGPSDETLAGHPYYRLGLRSYGFFEVENSAVIKELEEINKVHPYHDPGRWKEYKHYILTFHDNMFECIAVGFELVEENTTMHKKTAETLSGLFTDQL